MATLLFSLDIESASPIPANNLDRLALIRALGDIHATMPLIRFRTREKLIPAPPPGYLAFSWRFEMVDGREWEEVHCFADPPNGTTPFMSGTFGNYPTAIGFTIDPEVDRLRPVRLLTQRMTPLFGITDLHAKWI